MSDQHREASASVEPYFDRTPQPFGGDLVEPLVYDASLRALRQRTVNFAAKRLVDMRYVSRLDHTTAEHHFRWRPAVAPGGLAFRAAPDGQSELTAAQSRGDIVVEMDDADQCVTVRWNDASFGEPRLPGPAMEGSSWGRTQPCNSIRSRLPAANPPDSPLEGAGFEPSVPLVLPVPELV